MLNWRDMKLALRKTTEFKGIWMLRQFGLKQVETNNMSEYLSAEN